MGVTGSGKTFTMANVVQAVQRPTLVMSHNKTLAAQLYSEFKEFFPHNAVHYFVSYYDYYQPEAYIPQRDIYIEKDASINQQIDRLRLAATSALVSRRDVLIVASVSSIYGLGSPEDYRAMMVGLQRGQGRRSRLHARASWSISSTSGPTSSSSRASSASAAIAWKSGRATRKFALRVEFWGDEVEQLSIINPTSGEVIERKEELFIYPCQALRHAGGADQGGRGRDQARAGRAAGAAPPGRQAAGGPSAQRPHALRHRDDAGGGLLPGHRELQPAAERAGRRARRRTRCSASFPTISCCWSTSRTSPCRRSAACISATTTAR